MHLLLNLDQNFYSNYIFYLPFIKKKYLICIEKKQVKTIDLLKFAFINLLALVLFNYI